MAQVINTNIAALNSQRHLNSTQSSLQTTLERLSSGKRINSAKDDAAGLGISERMTTQVNGMNQAIRNANDGISMSQTAEGALASSGDMLQRIRTLAVQSSNATNASIDRQSLQDEVNQLTAELNRIATTTQFNGQKLLDGTMGAQNFQVGANAGDLITATGTNFQTNVYGDHRVYSQSTVAASGSGAFTVAKLQISGKFGKSAEIDTTDTAKFGSAKDVAAAINEQTDKTGVTATARTEALFKATSGESYSLNLKSNNDEAVTVSFTIGANQTNDDYAAAINSINAVSSKTGISAEWDSENTGIKLVNADGQKIGISAADGSAEDATLQAYKYASGTNKASLTATADIDTTGAETLGYVTYDSEASFNIAGDTTDYEAASQASHLNQVAQLDVTTFQGSQLAIKIADAAINTINAERAKYGALQSRFESTIKNLEVNSENTSNARSRIKDADYAAETAEMSRASILQQAGTAMLAQANQSKQTVLSLIG